MASSTVMVPCPTCRGKGYRGPRVCPLCEGKKVIEVVEGDDDDD